MWNMIVATGWIGIAILTASLVGFGLVIERFIAYSRAKANIGHLLPEIEKRVRNGDLPGAMEVCNRFRGVVPEIYAQAIDLELKPAEEGAGADLDETIWTYVRTVAIPKLRRFLPAIALIARSAPMLGLLGTVFGMIKLFSKIGAEGMGDPSQFTAGIGMALVTTAGGLLVAIPIIYCHGTLLGHVQSIENDIDRYVPSMLGWLRWVRASREAA